MFKRFLTVPANTRSWPPFSLVDIVISRTSVGKPSDDDPDLLKRLGQVIEAWSWLESMLRQSLVILFEGNQDASHAVYYSMHSLKARLDIIESVAKYVVPYCDERDGFISLITKARRLAKFRNNLVHGEIHSGHAKDFQLLVGNSRNPERFDVSDISVSEILRHVEAVERLSEQFAMAITSRPQHYVWLASSHKKFLRPQYSDPAD
ncbi:MAG: hypothetical protein RID11_02350 [Roseovarius sp.]|uniref:hypothetical protein n=1 Tax=Roseovarius sp. TaxID=1486281 RepID=UPI0032EFC3A2